MMVENWRQLLERFASGEEAAFERLWREYGEAIVNVIGSQLRGTNREVNSVANSILVSLAENRIDRHTGVPRWETFEAGDVDGLKKLLFRSVVRHCGTARKRKERGTTVPFSRLEGPGRGPLEAAAKLKKVTATGGLEDADETAAIEEAIAALRLAVDELPEDLREITRRFVDGESPQQIADSPGIDFSSRTVWRRLGKAKGLLAGVGESCDE